MTSIIRMSRRAISDIEDVADKVFYSEDLLEAEVICSDVITDAPSSLMAPEARTVLLCFDGAGLLTILITQEGEEQKVRIVGPYVLTKRARRIFELLEFVEYIEDEDDEEYEE